MKAIIHEAEIGDRVTSHDFAPSHPLGHIAVTGTVVMKEWCGEDRKYTIKVEADTDDPDFSRVGESIKRVTSRLASKRASHFILEIGGVR
tara:strand:- start:83 stop:352 length:270 start_codon:yes stop_codon:yes gene_type:complete